MANKCIAARAECTGWNAERCKGATWPKHFVREIENGQSARLHFAGWMDGRQSIEQNKPFDSRSLSLCVSVYGLYWHAYGLLVWFQVACGPEYRMLLGTAPRIHWTMTFCRAFQFLSEHKRRSSSSTPQISSTHWSMCITDTRTKERMREKSDWNDGNDAINIHAYTQGRPYSRA